MKRIRIAAVAVFAFLAAPSLLLPGVARAANLPDPTVQMNGRTAIVTMPYRTADSLTWVSATPMTKLAPFHFVSLIFKPSAGPGGSDLEVFTYTADSPGSVTLKFGLVPFGAILTGIPKYKYSGPITKKFETTLTAH